jgi:hypothetical protein
MTHSDKKVLAGIHDIVVLLDVGLRFKHNVLGT